jgi:hypothetical protein
VHRDQLHVELVEHVDEQVVGQRPGGLDPLEREGDRVASTAPIQIGR